ncbi:MAG: erythromycin esterase family protein [Planctomycetes bacterium]|nr:erythromycin esterase family protein [Planctomycetota bacterium]
MKNLINCILIGLTLLVSTQSAFSAYDEKTNLVKVYEVGKKVSDFPVEENFSTPENAYATINRLRATGDQGFWRRVTVKRLAKGLPKKPKKRKVSKKAANKFLKANIVEVSLFQGEYAGVVAKVPHLLKTEFDYRSFELKDGKWKNAGNSVFESVEESRLHFGKLCSRRIKKPKRPRVDDPEAHLKPFINFLIADGQNPMTFALNALAENKVLIIGEVHHRPLYWDFNSSLVANERFSKHAGTIYLELPSDKQPLVDKFLASDKCDEELIIDVLRSFFWMGWPDQAMLDFFTTVWKTNQNLKPKDRLRIVLVDMERPWEKIKKREDWRRYGVDRDKYMAKNLLEDINKHPDEKRNRLFLVGVGHTALNFNISYFGDTPQKTAGWHLRQALGEDVYAIMQHRCVMTNNGRVDGRLQLGLFDSAFEACGKKPIAFSLKEGPFGELTYDGQPDMQVWSKFRDGFNGYLYLGPLEDEIFSPLIDSFYTDEFVREMDRRVQLMHNKSLKEMLGKKNIVDWMKNSWGKPRKWRNELGPIDAWKLGDDWEDNYRKKNHEIAFKDTEMIKGVAKQLIDTIRNADYEHHRSGRDWQKFLAGGGSYQVHTDFSGWVQWICETFKDNPIKSVTFGQVFKNRNELPAIPYTIKLQDGHEMTGVLPFKYMPREEGWMGIEGIDWHLKR